MPGARVFIDSNVLLYTRDRNVSDKTEKALHWLRTSAGRNQACANLQVLNEVTHVMLRKMRVMTTRQVFEEVDGLRFLGVTPVGKETVLKARALRLETSYSWWDCLLLGSAVELGCTHFLSEDLQDGRTIEGLTIVDPFAHSPERILAS
jgi:predicted nucleic acid-binding protein